MENKKYSFDINLLSNYFDALSNPTRIEILLHLSKYYDCPAKNVSIKLPLSKSTISQHFAKLKRVELINCFPQGLCHNYYLNIENFRNFKKNLILFLEEIETNLQIRNNCT